MFTFFQRICSTFPRIMGEPVEKVEMEPSASHSGANGSTYEKAAQYWANVEPTISGMLGGINVGFLGKLKC